MRREPLKDWWTHEKSQAPPVFARYDFVWTHEQETYSLLLRKYAFVGDTNPRFVRLGRYDWRADTHLYGCETFYRAWEMKQLVFDNSEAAAAAVLSHALTYESEAQGLLDTPSTLLFECSPQTPLRTWAVGMDPRTDTLRAIGFIDEYNLRQFIALYDAGARTESFQDRDEAMRWLRQVHQKESA